MSEVKKMVLKKAYKGALGYAGKAKMKTAEYTGKAVLASLGETKAVLTGLRKRR